MKSVFKPLNVTILWLWTRLLSYSARLLIQLAMVSPYPSSIVHAIIVTDVNVLPSHLHGKF